MSKPLGEWMELTVSVPQTILSVSADHGTGLVQIDHEDWTLELDPDVALRFSVLVETAVMELRDGA